MARPTSLRSRSTSRSLSGTRFIDAVAEARQAAYKFEGNTWAAYQCYGDPDWRLLRDGGWRRVRTSLPAHEFDTVASVTALKLALETLQVQTKFQDYDSAYQLKRLAHLEARWKDRKWRASNGVAELFAQTYAARGICVRRSSGTTPPIAIRTATCRSRRWSSGTI